MCRLFVCVRVCHPQGLDEVEEVTGHHKGSTSTGKARVAGGSGGRMAGGRPPSDTDAFDTLRVDRKQVRCGRGGDT